MWRVVGLVSLVSLAILGTAAYAECTSCLTSVFVQPSLSGTGTNVELNFTARAEDGAALPDQVTAVVMQVDGQRTKCQNVTLLKKTADSHGVARYSGSFYAYGTYSHSGRVDFGGQIFEFAVPLDGKAGTISLAADQTSLPANRTVVQVTAAPATPAPTAAPATGIQLPQINPTFAIGAAVVVLTIIGAYIDRRRALARSLSG